MGGSESREMESITRNVKINLGAYHAMPPDGANHCVPCSSGQGQRWPFHPHGGIEIEGSSHFLISCLQGSGALLRPPPFGTLLSTVHNLLFVNPLDTLLRTVKQNTNSPPLSSRTTPLPHSRPRSAPKSNSKVPAQQARLTRDPPARGPNDNTITSSA
jgi:hypothetical protein